MHSTASEISEEYFSGLDQRGLSYVVLSIGADIDVAVLDADLPAARHLLGTVARARGWQVVQTWHHEVCSFYYVLVDPKRPSECLAIDLCSHFTSGRRLLARDRTLLAGRSQGPEGFFVPSPASESIYLLAKTLQKRRSFEKVLPRLQHLWTLDPAGAGENFAELFGRAAEGVPDESWQSLADELDARTHYGVALWIAEGFRLLGRVLRPSGLHIALLGPDGAGKTTLIENLRRTLQPCFSQQRVFKFRPDVFGRIEPGTNSTPHEREPRGVAVSWAKVLYYFADWWLGWFGMLAPITRRGGLVVLDRNFDDMLVDQRRYLVRGVGALVRLLRWWIPRPDVTFVLAAEPAAIHARKPELPVDVLERQRDAYAALAKSSGRFRLVNANAPSEEVAQAVTQDILSVLAVREGRREIPASKRAFDVAIALPLGLLLLPLLAWVALLVAVTHGLPVVFRQTRPGLHGQPFTIYKFRTMTSARDASGKLLPDEMRLTRFGRFLRSTSVDELPELLNVIKGDMSLVGPRPLLMSYLPLYTPEQRRRHEVLPGITGWAQVNGRNAASWPQKFRLDIWYVDHQSRWLDFKILGRTVWTVLKREGINTPGVATAERFRGEACEAET